MIVNLLRAYAPNFYGVDTNRFGDNVEFVHCINMLPFTPITEDLLGRDFMEQEWPVLETAFDNSDLGALVLAAAPATGCRRTRRLLFRSG